MARRKQTKADAWRTRIAADPRVCGGAACVTGTRIMVSVVLDNLAAGLSPGEIVEHYPTLEVEDVHAVLAFAAELSKGRLVAP